MAVAPQHSVKMGYKSVLEFCGCDKSRPLLL